MYSGFSLKLWYERQWMIYIPSRLVGSLNNVRVNSSKQQVMKKMNLLFIYLFCFEFL